jgi:hypothetical protein
MTAAAISDAQLLIGVQKICHKQQAGVDAQMQFVDDKSTLVYYLYKTNIKKNQRKP